MNSNISNLKNKDRIKRKRKRKRKDKPKTYKEKLIRVRHRKRIRSKERMLTVDKMQTNKNNAEDDVKIGYSYFTKKTSL
jgi:hypothetical protein